MPVLLCCFLLGEEETFPMHVHFFFSFSFIHKVTLAGTKMKISCKQNYFAVEVQYGESSKTYQAFPVWALLLIMDYLT